MKITLYRCEHCGRDISDTSGEEVWQARILVSRLVNPHKVVMNKSGNRRGRRVGGRTIKSETIHFCGDCRTQVSLSIHTKKG